MTLDEIIAYETATCSFIMSFLYNLFPRYFLKHCMRKHKRLMQFKIMCHRNNVKPVGMLVDFETIKNDFR